jgi:anti-sigma factor RsiW
VCAYTLQVLPASEVAAAEAHIASCSDCQRELKSLRPVVNRLRSGHQRQRYPSLKRFGRAMRVYGA